MVERHDERCAAARRDKFAKRHFSFKEKRNDKESSRYRICDIPLQCIDIDLQRVENERPRLAESLRAHVDASKE